MLLSRTTTRASASLGAPAKALHIGRHPHRPHHQYTRALRLPVSLRTQAVAAAGPTERAEAAAGKEITSVSATGLPRTSVVGVLGGGQLGRMMALAAANLGVKLRVLDPAPRAPAADFAHQVRGHFRDAADIHAFAADVDVLTIEIEHVDADALEAVGWANNIAVHPTPATLRIIQDKFLQKQFFEAAGVPSAAFCDVATREDLVTAGQRFGYPFMLKSKCLAYDGKGNFLVRSAASLDAAAAALGGLGKGLYVEQFAPFVKELAVMVVRSADGSVRSYPVVETVHRDNICHVTEAPADVPEGVRNAAALVAEKAISCLEGAGIFGVEMFLLPDGRLLLNEVAPRPHNSGHYTMDGCVTSQFENHVRAVLGWPLGDTSLTCASSVMLNLLGECEGDEGVQKAHALMAKAYTVPGAKVHWYGKEGMSVGRKVGHINISASSRAEGREKLALLDPSAAAALQVSTNKAAAVGLTASSHFTSAASNGHSSHTAGSGSSSAAPSMGIKVGSSSTSAVPASARGQAAGDSAGRDMTPRVGIIMGSDSDLSTMKAAAQILEEFGVPMELTIVSAHRTPERMMEYARTAHTRGLRAIIAGAGGAAHLPGMVAAMTPLPVIGVPVRPAGAYLDGMDALLSIVQMPKGVPVATVAIGNAANAGLLAVRIMSAYEPALLDKMLAYQAAMKDTVMAKATSLEASGWANYSSAPH